MATCQLLSLLAALTFTSPPDVVDLSQIARSIEREPDYASRLPKYGLLVLGPEMRTRVWLVLDGSDLYVDRNGNGDVSEPDERIALKTDGRWTRAPAISLRGADGKERNLEMRIRDRDQASGKCSGWLLVLDGEKRFVGFDPSDPFRFAQQAARAPMVHLDGPLHCKLHGESPTLIAGDEVELKVAIGTPGVGPGSFCAIPAHAVLECQVTPAADMAFPAARGQLPPPPLSLQLGDDHRDYFAGTVRAPRDAGSGLAKVTLYCDEWLKATVQPLTLELPVTRTVMLPVVQQPPALRHAAEVQGVKSIHSDHETSIKIVNHSKQTIRIYWLDFDGSRVHKDTLSPGDWFGSHRTFVTHPWLVTDHNENAWYIFHPDVQPRTVDIVGPPSPARTK